MSRILVVSYDMISQKAGWESVQLTHTPAPRRLFFFAKDGYSKENVKSFTPPLYMRRSLCGVIVISSGFKI